MTHILDVPGPVDLGTGKRARVQSDDVDIALFNIDGQIYAIDDSCPHNGASLLFGKLDGRFVRCPAHGLSFDLATGCMRGGGMNVRAYPVEVVADRIRITLPTPITRHQ